MGRFISEDPIGLRNQMINFVTAPYHRDNIIDLLSGVYGSEDFPSQYKVSPFSSGDFNNYRYVFNGAFNLLDPSGMVPDRHKPKKAGGEYICFIERIQRNYFKYEVWSIQTGERVFVKIVYRPEILSFALLLFNQFKNLNFLRLP